MESILLSLPINILGIFFAGIAFLAGMLLLFLIRKTEYIIYFLLIWFPLESLFLMYTPIEYFTYVKYVPELFMYGLACGSFISYVRRAGRLLPKTPLIQWFVAFVCVAGVSFFLNWYSPFVWMLGLRQVLRFMLLVFVIFWMDYDQGTLRAMMKLGISMILLEAGFGLMQYVGGGSLDKYLFSTRTVSVGNTAILGGLEEFWTPGSRVFATMGRYDRLGSFLALGLVMLFPLYFYISKQRQKIWYAAAMIIGLGTLYLTSSRASWIAAIVGMFVIGVVVKRDRRVMIAGAVVLGCALIYLIGFAVVKQNISSITEKPTQSFGERVFEAVSLRAWRESYDGYGRIFFIINTPRMVIREFPFFGVGPGRYGGGVAAALLMTDVYDRLHLPFGIQNIYGQIDNNWMSIWGETGTFGLLVWIGMFVSVMHMAWYVIQKTESREEKMIAEGVLGFTAGLICMGFFGPYFEFRALMFYYWTIAGIVMLYWYREKHRGNILEGK